MAGASDEVLVSTRDPRRKDLLEELEGPKPKSVSRYEAMSPKSKKRYRKNRRKKERKYIERERLPENYDQLE